MTFRLKGPYGLRQELKLSPTKRTIRDCFWDYNMGHYPLKTFNRILNQYLCNYITIDHKDWVTIWNWWNFVTIAQNI
jgi:hypothetical protein